MKRVRIGAGQGFWGDTPFGALESIKSGEISYIICDALAELTLALLQKARQKDPAAGYVTDNFFPAVLPLCAQKGVKIISNAGGMNPAGAGKMVLELGKSLGLTGLKVAIVTGDDLLPKLDDLQAQGISFSEMLSGAQLSTIRDKIVFANAYLGARGIVTALEQGADVVITGRVADPSLFLAPLVFELGWSWDDWDLLAAGCFVGHLLECSAQSTGGNFGGNWQDIPALDNIGYPLAEVFADGQAIISKPKGTGGQVSLETVKEQMLYEVHDPKHYLTPDVVVDFTSPQLTQIAPDEVRVTAVKGRPRPKQLKVNIGYSCGWMSEGSLRYSWPAALEKAKQAEAIIRLQMKRLGLTAQRELTELIGYDSTCGQRAWPPGDRLNEVVLRMAAHFGDQEAANKFPRLFPPLALNGPPTASGISGVAKVKELFGLWSSLIPRAIVEAGVRVEVRGVDEAEGIG